MLKNKPVDEDVSLEIDEEKDEQNGGNSLSIDDNIHVTTLERKVRITPEERKQNYSILLVCLVVAVLVGMYAHSYVTGKSLPEQHLVLMSTILGSVVGYLFGERK